MVSDDYPSYFSKLFFSEINFLGDMLKNVWGSTSQFSQNNGFPKLNYRSFQACWGKICKSCIDAIILGGYRWIL